MVNSITKETTLTLNSKEVAVMMETRHDNLMRKISGINKDFNDHKIEVVDYWLESSYLDKKGEERKCYEITKRGCEFLAHKSTGTKGNLFTVRYMDKFDEMERTLKLNTPQLSRKEQLQLQILNGNDLERLTGLKEYKTEIEKPLLETINDKETVIETILPNKKLYGVSEVGRVLKGYNAEVMGEKKIFKYLHDNKILISSPKRQKHNAPYDKYHKYFKMKPVKVGSVEGSVYKPYFTGEGLNWFLNKLAKEGILKKETVKDIETKLS